MLLSFGFEIRCYFYKTSHHIGAQKPLHIEMLNLHPYFIQSPLYISDGFRIHGPTTRTLPCKGVPDTPVGGSTSKYLEDTSHDTCIAPLNDGSDRVKITLEILNNTNTLHVVIAMSNDATCDPPGVILAAETVDEHYVECTLWNDDVTNVNVRLCHFECICKRCCAFVHIHFYNLRVRHVLNTHWQLCDIQICFP